MPRKQELKAVKDQMEEAQRVAVEQAKAEARSGATPPRAGAAAGEAGTPRLTTIPDLASIRSMLGRHATAD